MPSFGTVQLIASTIAALDDAFADDLDEIIERVLLAYRPIFSHLVMAHFRSHLERAFYACDGLRSLLAPGPLSPLPRIGNLTPSQIVLLGGTHPTRVVHSLVADLNVLLDGGDKESLNQADLVLVSSFEALDSLAEHHVVGPVRGRQTRIRKTRELVELGIAAQIAATMGALYERQPFVERREREEEPELIQRYFLGMIQAFRRIRLSRKDQDVFRDYYLDAADIEELAEERGLELEVEVERRRRFLVRLAAALKAEIASRCKSADDSEALSRGSRAAALPALTQATARAGRPRTR